ncbi:hypothetical protein Ahy_A10g046815 isoform C [Arachis hypogaea]|uniref:Uncharacterized protein n=1 Tax=Arachis hypogaea TaxID=3818 RepID=A0A445B0L0_ARAHY|nr:hypothetical protein Ahy_A10g046815 isoform C [Arachis hypogaea]
MAKQKQVAPEDSDDESQVPRPQPKQEDSSEEEEAATSSKEDKDTDEGEDEREETRAGSQEASTAKGFLPCFRYELRQAFQDTYLIFLAENPLKAGFELVT